MTPEELQAKASRAKELADEIDLLSRCRSTDSGVRLSFVHWNTSEKILPDHLLEKLFFVGRDALIASRRAELESILNPQPPDPLPDLDMGVQVVCNCGASSDPGACGHHPDCPLKATEG